MSPKVSERIDFPLGISFGTDFVVLVLVVPVALLPPFFGIVPRLSRGAVASALAFLVVVPSRSFFRGIEVFRASCSCSDGLRSCLVAFLEALGMLLMIDSSRRISLVL